MTYVISVSNIQVGWMDGWMDLGRGSVGGLDGWMDEWVGGAWVGGFDRWMDGYGGFTSLSIVFQLYQDNGRVVMNSSAMK